MGAILFYCSIFFIPLSLIGQDQSFADSLKVELQTNKEFPNYDSTSLSLLWDISFNETNPEEKLKYSEQLTELGIKLSDSISIYRGIYQKGNAYKLKGELIKSAQTFLKASAFAKKMNYTKGVGHSFVSLADIYALQGNHNNSISYYNKSIEILTVLNDSIGLASAFLNTGYEYYLIEEYDSALSYYDRSKDLFAHLNYAIGIAYNIGNTGLVHARKNQNKLAEKRINEAIAILQKYGDSYSITEFQIEMANIYILAENASAFALKYYKNALSTSILNNYKERIRDASLKLSELYQSSGDFKRAYLYQSQYIAYRDSINNEETIRQMADLRTDYEVGQKQAELELVEAQQEAERERSYIIGGALLAVLILIGIIAYIQYKSSKQRKATNIQLAAQKQQLERLNQTKDRFFSIISHDLRGPVNAFAGISKLIKMYLRKGKVEEINDMAEDIDESAGRLSSLLDNLLEWAVQQQGQFPYTPEKINFNKITKELEATFETTASGKEIHLHSKIEEDIILFVDKNSVTTIFRNLVGNALKFTPEGGEVFFDAKLQNESVLLSVNDTGVGIPKEKFDKLFTLSENKSTWGTAGEKGLGLGLQLAYEFTEMNKGAITVESTEGKGTSFIVELPLFEKSGKKNEATTV
ncbi:MAG: ATP-binding protein [Bacteroidota bacterium]